MIFFAFGAQALPIERQCPGWLQRARAKAPLIRRHKPGPAQRIAFPNSLQGRETPVRNQQFHRDQSFADEEKLIRGVPFAEDNLTFPKTYVFGASGNEPDVALIQSFKERVLAYESF